MRARAAGRNDWDARQVGVGGGGGIEVGVGLEVGVEVGVGVEDGIVTGDGAANGAATAASTGPMNVAGSRTVREYRARTCDDQVRAVSS